MIRTSGIGKIGLRTINSTNPIKGWYEILTKIFLANPSHNRTENFLKNHWSSIFFGFYCSVPDIISNHKQNYLFFQNNFPCHGDSKRLRMITKSDKFKVLLKVLFKKYYCPNQNKSKIRMSQPIRGNYKEQSITNYNKQLRKRLNTR